ncbi:sulfotransferase [Robertkochia solimangrovi]|uniref:sulfotransferase n=1 Tax=Robertkochia solimangrovi TaxID=2213046 RepID=UPI0013A53977|nr:sulfotransferase [Robertkochia solimangrovi]TRZ44956.1 hypothetical protein DMZ48_04115 [Robertkochia solimangrovi]
MDVTRIYNAIQSRGKRNTLKIVNRLYNGSYEGGKIFCIGLHKTGTSTLAHFVECFGLKVTHSVDWIDNPSKISKYDFFSDGGSHFDGMNEIDYKWLFYEYPDALFILQTRDTRKWLMSKLRHAGWNEETCPEPDDIAKISQENWRGKTLLHIQKYVEHKSNYERSIREFFEENGKDRLYEIDITDKMKQEKYLKGLKSFLNLRSVVPVELPHSNRLRNSFKLPPEVSDFIEKLFDEDITESSAKNQAS